MKQKIPSVPKNEKMPMKKSSIPKIPAMDKVMKPMKAMKKSK